METNPLENVFLTHTHSPLVDDMISRFVRSVGARSKIVTPDLGELLVLLLISSKFTWQQVSSVFLQEFFDRLVLWMLGKSVEWVDGGENNIEETIRKP
jgi:hypothetical protein